jgi:hypothetical protein
MNGCKIKGIILVMSGSVQARIADLVGNSQLGYAAHARIMHGRSSIAIGDAQAIIKRCLRRSAQSHRAMTQLPGQMTTQLHSQAH